MSGVAPDELVGIRYDWTLAVAEQVCAETEPVDPIVVDEATVVAGALTQQGAE